MGLGGRGDASFSTAADGQEVPRREREPGEDLESKKESRAGEGWLGRAVWSCLGSLALARQAGISGGEGGTGCRKLFVTGKVQTRAQQEMDVRRRERTEQVEGVGHGKSLDFRWFGLDRDVRIEFLNRGVCSVADAIPRFKGTSAAVKAGSSCFEGPMEAGMSRKSSIFSEPVTHTIGLESRLFFGDAGPISPALPACRSVGWDEMVGMEGLPGDEVMKDSGTHTALQPRGFRR